jgi:hypothetical protein
MERTEDGRMGGGEGGGGLAGRKRFEEIEGETVYYS